MQCTNPECINAKARALDLLDVKGIGIIESPLYPLVFDISYFNTTI